MIGTLTVFFATPAFGQATLAPTDRAFMVQSAQLNVAEIASGKLAEQKGSPDAWKLGMHFVDNHSVNEKKLSAIASSLGFSLPMRASAADQMAMMKLSGLSGAAFDSAYIKMKELGHVKNIAAFKKEAAWLPI